MIRRRPMPVLVSAALLGALLWPTNALAAEGCEALNPKACMDAFLHSSLVQLMRAIWFFDRPLLLIARWIEGLRSYLVEGVLATAFDATIAGVQTPFWMMAATAWCVFVIGYMASVIADFRWVNLRRGVWYCALAALLFQWGSQALAATEELRNSVGQGFSQLAQQSVEDAGTPLTFFAANDSSMQRPHPLYSGDADCPGTPTRRTDPAAMHLNDYTANYLWADARDIHCPTTTGGSSELPRAFAKGNGSFGGYVPKEQIDQEEESERTRLIGLAQDGAMRLALGLLMAFGAVLEQTLYLFFTLALATAWIGLLISLLFVLFVSGESMFTKQIRAGITIIKASWLSSIWIGIMLAIVRQAANTGNGVVVFGAMMVTVGVVIWQLKGAFGLLMSTLDQVGNSVLSGAPAALGSMIQKVSGVAVTAAAMGGGAVLATSGAALSGAMAARNHNEGWAESGGNTTAEKSGSGAFGLGAALAGVRPLRRAGQLAKTMGIVSDHDPLIQGLTRRRTADPFSWANARRDRASGREVAQQRVARQQQERVQQEHDLPAPTGPERRISAPEAAHPGESAAITTSGGAGQAALRQARPTPAEGASLRRRTRETGGPQQPEGSAPSRPERQIDSSIGVERAGSRQEGFAQKSGPPGEASYRRSADVPPIDQTARPQGPAVAESTVSVAQEGIAGDRAPTRLTGRPAFRFVMRRDAETAPEASTGRSDIGDAAAARSTPSSRNRGGYRKRGQGALATQGQSEPSTRTTLAPPSAEGLGSATMLALPFQGPVAAEAGRPTSAGPLAGQRVHQLGRGPLAPTRQTKEPPITLNGTGGNRTPTWATGAPQRTLAPLVAPDVALETLAVPATQVSDTTGATSPPASAPATEAQQGRPAYEQTLLDAGATPTAPIPPHSPVASQEMPIAPAHSPTAMGMASVQAAIGKPLADPKAPVAVQATPGRTTAATPKATRRPWAERASETLDPGSTPTRSGASLPRATTERKGR